MNTRIIRPLLILCLLLPVGGSTAHTRQDTLRGSNGRGRDWWDVVKYGLLVKIDTATRSIAGSVAIVYKVINAPRDSFQIDLQGDLVIDSAWVWKSAPFFWRDQSPFFSMEGMMKDSGHFVKARSIHKEGNVWWIVNDFKKYDTSFDNDLLIWYHGRPRTAVSPPWDGGFIWTKDSMGQPWIAVACQGLGASSWWPCKDYQGDEPDNGMDIDIDFGKKEAIMNGKTEFHHYKKAVSNEIWDVSTSLLKAPISTYNTTFYIGNYAHWHDTLQGEKGILDLDFYPLKYNEDKARRQWAVAKDMLRCYEYWLGPYPFYEDGYKLVEAPYLGMEHQSAIAYGNQYKMGYLGKDRSGTGVGLAFDYIIIHESGHEWFGNSVTARDIADNWLHEGFTTYTETLFAAWIKGKDSAFAYAAGEWKNIKNDRPVIGDYGVNDAGSGDRYDKGASVVHMIRMMLNDDQRFRQLMRGLNRDFYHRIVTSREVEDYISRFAGMDLKPFFDVYLRSTIKPVLEWHESGYRISCKWKNVPAGFVAPFVISDKGGAQVRNAYSSTTYFDFKRDDEQPVPVKACGWYDVAGRK